MQYRQLGQTDMQLSALGFGASPLGGVFGAIDETDGVRSVHAALDGGINYIDVAPFYGVTRAEAVLGRALKDIPRDRYYLSTKVGRYDQHEFDFSAERITRSLDESLRRLNIDYADIVICHDIEHVDLEPIIEEAIPALHRLRETGKLRYIGISGYPLTIFHEVLNRVQVDVVLSYCRYTLYDTALTTLVPLLQEKGVGLINAAPLAMGLLTQSGPPDWHPAPAPLKQTCAQAATYCADNSVDIAELAIQYALAYPEAASTLVGMHNQKQLAQNLKAAETPLDGHLLREVQAILEPVKNMAWPSGLPQNN